MDGDAAVALPTEEGAEIAIPEETEPTTVVPTETITDGDEIVAEENGEQYTISEETAILDGQPIQMVSLTDAAGNLVDQKHGQAGEQVVIELHGQALAYEIRGPTETGEAITVSYLLVVGITF